MGEEFAQQFKEIFHCVVRGKDIAEGRFHAFEALETALGDCLHQKHMWKLSQMQHEITSGPDPKDETKAIVFIQTEAVWVFDPDSDGGTHAELLPPDSSPEDGVENEDNKPKLSLVGDDSLIIKRP